MKKLIIVGKCSTKNSSGPSNIIRGLIVALEKQNRNFEYLLWDGEKSKVGYIVKLNKILRKEKCNVVNVHTDGYILPLFVLVFSKFYTTHSYYLTIHGIYQIEAQFTGEVKRLYVLLEKILYKCFPNLICVSELLKDNVKTLFKREKEISVIPNATDACSNSVYKKSEEIEVVSMGGLRKRKGIGHIINLAEIMNQYIKSFHISIYGISEGNEKWFVDQIKRRGLEKHISYIGNLDSKQDVYDVIKKADVQLCLSDYDSFNVAIAESLVLGCPCIASDMCGAAYLINNNFNGLVVNVEKEEGSKFKKTIEYINGLTEDKRIEIEDKTEYYSKILSWKNVVQMYMNLK